MEPLIQKLLEDKDERVRWSAEEAFKKIDKALGGTTDTSTKV